MRSRETIYSTIETFGMQMDPNGELTEAGMHKFRRDKGMIILLDRPATVIAC